jgi:hypothetical protein
MEAVLYDKVLLTYNDSLTCLLGFVLDTCCGALAVWLPGGDYNTHLWIPQGTQGDDEVTPALSPGGFRCSGTLARSKGPINPRSATAGACTAS